MGYCYSDLVLSLSGSISYLYIPAVLTQCTCTMLASHRHWHCIQNSRNAIVSKHVWHFIVYIVYVVSKYYEIHAFKKFTFHTVGHCTIYYSRSTTVYILRMCDDIIVRDTLIRSKMNEEFFLISPLLDIP